MHEGTLLKGTRMLLLSTIRVSATKRKSPKKKTTKEKKKKQKEIEEIAFNINDVFRPDCFTGSRRVMQMGRRELTIYSECICRTKGHIANMTAFLLQ